jgi:hypothetical protein
MTAIKDPHLVSDGRDYKKCSDCGQRFSSNMDQLGKVFASHVREKHPKRREDVNQVTARIVRDATE